MTFLPDFRDDCLLCFIPFCLICILLVLPLFIFKCFIVLCGNWTLGEPEGKVSFYACVINNTIILNF